MRHILTLILIMMPLPSLQSCCFLPPVIVPDCDCTEHGDSVTLGCTNLHNIRSEHIISIFRDECEYFRYLTHIQQVTAKVITNIEISDSIIDCLDTSHLRRFSNIRVLNVTNSMMKQILCPQSSVDTLANIQHLNFTNNQIQQLGGSMADLHQLESLDLSQNHLSETLDPEEFSSLPSSLTSLVLTSNPWMCVPTLSWLHSWVHTMPHLHQQLEEVECRVQNSYQMAPLLEVAKIYSTHVNPYCSVACSCVFHFFVSPSYTVIVNCTRSNLRYFPVVPYRSVLLLQQYSIHHPPVLGPQWWICLTTI